MKRLVASLLLLGSAAAWAQTAYGPSQAWNVFTLPNEAVTPNWKSNKTYIPRKCRRNPDACANDNRFWDGWDFSSDFAGAISSSFRTVDSVGQYQGVMLLMPLSDVTDPSIYFAQNIRLMYTSAHNDAVIPIQAVLFPKWKYGAEWCYLYAANAPSNCQLFNATTGEALAHQKLVQLMDYVQTLPSGGCNVTGKQFNNSFAIWYGWDLSEFPYQGNNGQVLKAFWDSLPQSGTPSRCNLQASYMTWLDSGWYVTGDSSGYAFVDSPDVLSLQSHVEDQTKKLYVDTELYSYDQITTLLNFYHNQTVVTGTSGTTNVSDWKKDMCTKWGTWASSPSRLGVWTFYDRDVGTQEQYHAYFPGQTPSMAVISQICLQ